MAKKIWNQDDTVKYNPDNVAEFEIKPPGKCDYTAPGGIDLTRFQLNLRMVDVHGEPAIAVCHGYYDTHEEAKVEADRIDALSDKQVCEHNYVHHDCYPISGYGRPMRIIEVVKCTICGQLSTPQFVELLRRRKELADSSVCNNESPESE